MKWYLGSQGEGHGVRFKYKVNKGQWNKINFRKRQFVNTLIVLKTFPRIMNKRIMIPVKQKTNAFYHK